MAKGLHFIYLYADSEGEWNCSQWRALTPSNAINAENEAGRTPHTAQLFHLPSALQWHNPQVQKKLGMGDVLVFQRNIITEDVHQAMAYWRTLGKLVVIDLDDHYPELPPSNPAHEYWTRNRHNIQPEPLKALEEGMRHGDFLISPSKVICKDWEYVVPGRWVPNWAQRKWYEGLTQKPVGAPDKVFGYKFEAPNKPPVPVAEDRPDSQGWIVLGWGGSISHVDSWLYSGVVEALDRLFEKHANVRLKFCGGESRLDYILNRWGDKVVRQQGVLAQDWPVVVTSFDIGLAPLDTRPLEPQWSETALVAAYDERRSWLKAIEYLGAGVPWVASDSHTYRDLAKWGTLVKNTPEAWFTTLDEKVTHIKQQKAQAWERRRWAMKHVMFEPQVNAYAQMFYQMLADKNARKGGRLPAVTYVG